MEDSFQLQYEFALFLNIIIVCLSENCSVYALRTYVMYLFLGDGELI